MNNGSVIDMEAARRERRKKRAQEELSRHKEASSPEKEAYNRRKAQRTLQRRLIYALILVVVVAIIGTTGYQIIKLQGEAEAASARLKALEEEKAALEDELKKISDPEYIEQKARDELHMILPGETQYIIKEENGEEGQ